MADAVSQVLRIIAEKGAVDPSLVVPEARLADLNIASLDVVEIIFALEEMFDIQIPFNANDAKRDFATVGCVVRAVETLLAERG